MEQEFRDRHQMSPPVGSMMATYDLPTSCSELQNLLKPESSLTARRAASRPPTSPLRHMFPSATSVGMTDLGDGVVTLKQEFISSPEHSQHMSLTPPLQASPPLQVTATIESMAEAREQQASLMSGISQLASDIVEAQESEAESRLSQMASEVATSFVMTPTDLQVPHTLGESFLESMHHRQMDTIGFQPEAPATQVTFGPMAPECPTQVSPDSTVQSSECHNDGMGIGHLLPLDVSCLGHHQQPTPVVDSAIDAFMAMTTPAPLEATTTTVSAQHGAVTMFTGAAEVAVATMHSHKPVSENHCTEVNAALHNLKEDTCDLLHDNSNISIVSNPCTSQSVVISIPVPTASATTSDLLCPPPMSATCTPPEFPCLSLTADGGISYPSSTSCVVVSDQSSATSANIAAATTATPAATTAQFVESVAPPPVQVAPQIKREPAMTEPGVGTHSTADNNYFQQSVTMISQMSEADLLLIINPSTFDSSEYRW